MAEHVELRGESIISNCHTADSVDYKMLRCEMFSDSEESTISDSSGDSDDQVDSGEKFNWLAMSSCMKRNLWQVMMVTMTTRKTPIDSLQQF